MYLDLPWTLDLVALALAWYIIIRGICKLV